VSSGITLVSTTLTHDNEATIADALLSVVDWVDVCLVIDTGVTDRTLDLARIVAGEKCVVRAFEWVEDFAIARNFALDTAAEIGGNWSITVDTDERIETRGEDIRAPLAGASEDVLMMMDEAGAYAKERLFRLPARGRFSGPTHEAFLGFESRRTTLERARFVELPKDEEALRAKLIRDAAVLGKHSAAHPDDPRWLYYLGDTLQNLDRLDEAVTAFRGCALLRGWNEESAWACYRSAVPTRRSTSARPASFAMPASPSSRGSRASHHGKPTDRNRRPTGRGWPSRWAILEATAVRSVALASGTRAPSTRVRTICCASHFGDSATPQGPTRPSCFTPSRSKPVSDNASRLDEPVAHRVFRSSSSRSWTRQLNTSG
jgi:hypothetical protein